MGTDSRKTRDVWLRRDDEKAAWLKGTSELVDAVMEGKLGPRFHGSTGGSVMHWDTSINQTT